MTGLGDAGPGDASRGRGRAAVAIAAALGLAVLLLFLGDRRPPELSPILEHRAALGAAMPQSCLACHARNAARPPPPGHTGRQDCGSCHHLASSSR